MQEYFKGVFNILVLPLDLMLYNQSNMQSQRNKYCRLIPCLPQVLQDLLIFYFYVVKSLTLRLLWFTALQNTRWHFLIFSNIRKNRSNNIHNQQINPPPPKLNEGWRDTVQQHPKGQPQKCPYKIIRHDAKRKTKHYNLQDLVKDFCFFVCS